MNIIQESHSTSSIHKDSLPQHRMTIKQWNHLPRELLIKIFDFISMNTVQEFQKEGFLLASKDFYKLRSRFFFIHRELLDHAISKTFQQEAKLEEEREKNSKPIRLIKDLITFVTTQFFRQPPNPFLPLARDIATQAVTFCLQNTSLKVKALQLFAKAFNNIKYLDLQMVRIFPGVMEQFSQLRQLEELHFGDIIGSDTRGTDITRPSTSKSCLVALQHNLQPITTLSNLKALTINAAQIQTKEIKDFFKMTALIHLHFIRCIIALDTTNLHSLSSPLRHVAFTNCSGVTTADLSLVLRQPQLESFVFVRNASKIHQPVTINFSEIVNKNGFHEFFCTDHATGGEEPYPVVNFTSIQQLDLLTNLKKVTCCESGILDTNFSKLQNLEVLRFIDTLIDPMFSTPQALQNFSKITSLPNLHTLAFDHCDIGIPNFFSILAKCPQLQNLSLQRVSRTDLDNPDFHELNTIKTLKKLDCRDVAAMNHTILISLLALPLLEELNITGCTQITTEARNDFMIQGPRVRVLY